jgi:hypothetical protein
LMLVRAERRVPKREKKEDMVVLRPSGVEVGEEGGEGGEGGLE